MHSEVPNEVPNEGTQPYNDNDNDTKYSTLYRYSPLVKIMINMSNESIEVAAKNFEFMRNFNYSKITNTILHDADPLYKCCISRYLKGRTDCTVTAVLALGYNLLPNSVCYLLYQDMIANFCKDNTDTSKISSFAIFERYKDVTQIPILIPEPNAHNYATVVSVQFALSKLFIPVEDREGVHAVFLRVKFRNNPVSRHAVTLYYIYHPDCTKIQFAIIDLQRSNIFVRSKKHKNGIVRYRHRPMVKSTDPDADVYLKHWEEVHIVVLNLPNSIRETITETVPIIEFINDTPPVPPGSLSNRPPFGVHPKVDPMPIKRRTVNTENITNIDTINISPNLTVENNRPESETDDYCSKRKRKGVTRSLSFQVGSKRHKSGNKPGTRRTNPGARPNNHGTRRNNHGTRRNKPGARPNNHGTRPNNHGTRRNNHGANVRPVPSLSEIGRREWLRQRNQERDEIIESQQQNAISRQRKQAPAEIIESHNARLRQIKKEHDEINALYREMMTPSKNVYYEQPQPVTASKLNKATASELNNLLNYTKE